MNCFEPPPSFSTAQAKVEALLNPRNVVIVGASDAPESWALKAYQNLRRYNFPGPVYPFNPRRERVWDTRCYRSFDELPEPPDHVVVMIPAPFVPDTLRDAARAGARSATVMSSGLRRIRRSGREGVVGKTQQRDRRDRPRHLRPELHG